MKRRAFIAGLGAVACPLAAWSQQARPVVGYLGSASPGAWTVRLKPFATA